MLMLLNKKEIKSKELEILIFFDKYCKENHLHYFLAGGTLLGAIRHKGFIPWDDDIDVCMPRNDYERFVNSFAEVHPSFSIRTKMRGDFDAPFTKLVNKNIILDLKYTNSNTDKNLWIDIFPVDGLPNDIDVVKTIYKRTGVYRNILLLCDCKLGEGRTLFRKIAKFFLKPLSILYGKKRCIKNIESIAARYPYDNCDYVGIVTWGLYGVGERMLKSEFEKAVEVEFEGHKFPAFSCWDSYLRGLYGDYMQLPPVEKRKTHDMVAYLLDE